MALERWFFAPLLAYLALEFSLPMWAAPVVFLAPIGLAAPRLIAGVALLLLGYLAAADPLSTANHHVVMMAMMIWCLQGPSAASARSLYAALMGVASVQKMLSPTFRDGSFLTELLLEGGLFWPLFQVGPLAHFAEGNAALADSGAEVTLRGPGFSWVLGLVVSWGLLVWEGALAWWAWKSARLLPAAATAFVLVLPFCRDEWVFASAVAALTASFVPERRAKQLGRWSVLLAFVAVVVG